jgi:hypothetical protein
VENIYRNSAERLTFPVNMAFHLVLLGLDQGVTSAKVTQSLVIFIGLNLISCNVCHKTKLRGLSPRANYTYQTTPACRRSWYQLLADRLCHVVNVTDRLSRPKNYFFFQVAPRLYSRG